MDEVFYLDDNRMLTLYVENDNFISANQNGIVNRFYSVFRLQPNIIYNESCKLPNGDIALFESESDALDFGILYLQGRYGQLNNTPNRGNVD